MFNRKTIFPGILFVMICFSFQFSLGLPFGLSLAPSLTFANDEMSLINTLPEKYQKRVIQNLELSGANRSQLLLAIQKIDPQYRQALGFILAHAPARDLQELTTEFLIENIHFTYMAKKNTPWGNSIPEDIFLNNVLPYAHVTEKRENWRKDFYQRFLSIAVSEGSIQKAVKRLNQEVFTTFNVRYSATLRQKPDQSPSESMAIGWSSCTGLSILIADALRAVGIPARLAGIPVWPTGGNHTWVEVWDNGWHYFEAASAGDYDSAWFSGQTSSLDPNGPNEMNRVYAVSFEWREKKFPLVWDLSADYVRAEDVTARYVSTR